MSICHQPPPSHPVRPTSIAVWMVMALSEHVSPDTLHAPCKSATIGAERDPVLHGEIRITGDDAEIPVSMTCTIEDEPDAVCDFVTVYGTLVIEHRANLTIDQDSTVDGLLSIEGDGRLNIDADLTITGDGGLIQGEFGSNASLNGVEATDTLTIAGATPGSRSTSLIVQGTLTINVEPVNGAYVVAGEGDIYLDTNNKTGTSNGWWIAEANSGGTAAYLLDVNVTITGSAHWLVQGHANAEINFDAECTTLTGAVTMTNGKMTFNQDFKTDGALTIQSASGSSPRMRVVKDIEVDFPSPS